MKNQVKSKQVNIVIEPTLYRIMFDNTSNVSGYIRELIMRDLAERRLITTEVLKELIGLGQN